MEIGDKEASLSRTSDRSHFRKDNRGQTRSALAWGPAPLLVLEKLASVQHMRYNNSRKYVFFIFPHRIRWRREHNPRENCKL